MHAHISARAVDEADFSGTEKWCWDCAGGRAQSARVSGSDGATAQAVCRPCVFLVTPMHAHISARAVDEADFSTEKWCWDCAGGRAESARVSGSDGATAQAVCRPWVCSCLCDVCFGGELDCGGCGARAATVGCRVNAIAICVKARLGYVEYTRDPVECVMSSVCASAHVLMSAHSMACVACTLPKGAGCAAWANASLRLFPG